MGKANPESGTRYRKKGSLRASSFGFWYGAIDSIGHLARKQRTRAPFPALLGLFSFRIGFDGQQNVRTTPWPLHPRRNVEVPAPNCSWGVGLRVFLRCDDRLMC